MKILEFMRNWTLPISMGTGVASYFILSGAECLRPYRPYMSEAVDALQPILIFSMLFLSFCKIKPKELKLVPWQWKLLCIQFMPELGWKMGYPFAIGLMIVFTLAILLIFKLKKWL